MDWIETTETKYITCQALSVNVTNPQPVLAVINQSSNPLIKNLQEWNLHLISLSINTAELPLFNCKRNINWQPVGQAPNYNFMVNRMNFSISFMSTAGAYVFNPVDSVAHPNAFNIGLLIGGKYQGVGMFLTYTSENANPVSYPNPTTIAAGINSINYPRSYFNVHAVQQMLDFVNTAIAYLLGRHQTPPTQFPSFRVNAGNQLYGFVYTQVDAISYSSLGLDLYTNGFLCRILDAFRWMSYKKSDVSLLGYDGLDNKLIISPNNLLIQIIGTTTYVEVLAEYNVISNMFDAHSLIITTCGSLSQLSQEQIPLSTTSANQMDPSSMPCLKNLDISYDSLIGNSLNNCYIQFVQTTLDRPLNIYGSQSLTDLRFNIYIQTIDNELIEILIPSVGMCSIKFCLKKKRKP